MTDIRQQLRIAEAWVADKDGADEPEPVTLYVFDAGLVIIDLPFGGHLTIMAHTWRTISEWIDQEIDRQEEEIKAEEGAQS